MFNIHPTKLGVTPRGAKQGLGTGEAYLISKVGGFRRDKIVVKYLKEMKL